MFKWIMTSFCISLQGTVFEKRPKKHAKETHDTWYYSMEGRETTPPPYLLVADEFKIRNDLISKLHSRDGKLLSSRDGARKARAKWLPDMYEQQYHCSNEPTLPDPRVEVYYNCLGLNMTREPRSI